MARNLKSDLTQDYTLDEYFGLEKASERRYEFWNGEIVCISGGSLEHGQISRNVFGAIHRQLGGRACQAFTADMAVKTPTLSPYRYPDASVVCGAVQTEQINGIDMLVNPILIAEVLSPTTEDRDRNEKRIAYQAIPSVCEYLIVSQEIPHVTHFVKQDTEWHRADYSMAAEAIICPSLDISLSLAEIYRDVTFE